MAACSSSDWSWNCVPERARRDSPRRAIRRVERRGLRGFRLAGQAGRQPRLVAAGGVAMDDALARHLVDERDCLLQRGPGGGKIVPVDGRADVAQRIAQARTELAIVLAMFQALAMRFGC